MDGHRGGARKGTASQNPAYRPAHRHHPSDLDLDPCPGRSVLSEVAAKQLIDGLACPIFGVAPQVHVDVESLARAAKASVGAVARTPAVLQPPPPPPPPHPAHR